MICIKCCFRILWSIPYAMLIYYTPFLIKNEGRLNEPATYYNFLLGFIWLINEVSR